MILLAAGGTGGHLFPAEALGVELIKRGLRVRLATDARALRYSGLFSRENDNIDVVPSETVRGRNPLSLARTAIMLGYGTAVALNLVRRLKPAAVVGFGGYPTLPPLMAARLLGVPGIIHDANAVLGRANRFRREPRQRDRDLVAGRARPRSGAGGQDNDGRHADASGDLAAAAVPFASPEPNGPLRLLVVGGSQGARVMSDIVPARDREAGAGTVEPPDPHATGARGRHGAGARGLRPAQDQAPSLRRSSPICRRGWRRAIWWCRAPAPARWPNSPRSAGPRFWCRCPARSIRTSSPMPACWPRSTARCASRRPNSRRTGWPRKFPRFAAEPARLTAMAASARTVGRLDAAERLADLVAKVARNSRR